MSEVVGFIGAGLMGTPMIRRLLAAGHKVLVWGRSAERLAAVLEDGAVLADGPADLARGCDVVMLCVSDTDAVEHVVFGANGLAAGLHAESVVLDFSSIQPEATRRFAARIAPTGASWVDAPVSGGPPGARAGTLTVTAGGESDAVERVRPIVAHLAGRLTHMGPVGAGQTTKLVNQVIVGSSFATLAEAVRLAAAAGVDAGRLTECLKGGFADSPLFQAYGPRMAARDWTPPLSRASTMVKDLRTAREVAGAEGVSLPMAAQALALLEDLAARLGGDVEPSALVLPPS